MSQVLWFIPPSTANLLAYFSRTIDLVVTYADARQKAHDVRLLLLLKFLDICGASVSGSSIFAAAEFVHLRAPICGNVSTLQFAMRS